MTTTEVHLEAPPDPVSFEQFSEWLESLGAGPARHIRDVRFSREGVSRDAGVAVRVERYAVNEHGQHYAVKDGGSWEPAVEVVWVPLRRYPGAVVCTCGSVPAPVMGSTFTPYVTGVTAGCPVHDPESASA